MPDSKSAKTAALELLERLEEDVTFDDILYELHVLQKIEEGRSDVEAGQTVDHDEVKNRLDQWLK
jgi:predicted transcriptional regulator